MKLIGMDDLIGLCDVNYVINLDCFILFFKTVSLSFFVCVLCILSIYDNRVIHKKK